MHVQAPCGKSARRDDAVPADKVQIAPLSRMKNPGFLNTKPRSLHILGKEEGEESGIWDQELDVFDSIPDPNYRKSIQDHVSKEGAMKSEDVADAIVFVVSLPRRANVSELLIRPTIDTAAM